MKLIINIEFLYYAIHDQINCSVNHRSVVVPCETGNLANADKWKIAFAILVGFPLIFTWLNFKNHNNNS